MPNRRPSPALNDSLLKVIGGHSDNLMATDLSKVYRHPAVQAVSHLMETSMKGRSFILRTSSVYDSAKPGFRQSVGQPSMPNAFCPKVMEDAHLKEKCLKKIVGIELAAFKSLKPSSGRCHLDPRVTCRTFVPIVRDGLCYGQALISARVDPGVTSRDVLSAHPQLNSPPLHEGFSALGTTDRDVGASLITLLQLALSEAAPAHAPEIPAPSEGTVLVHKSQAMRETLSQLDKVARSSLAVHLSGESGTGKSLLARRLHAKSSVTSGPFVAENCAAIPEELLESALFGHVKGAFTGATENREGLFQQAHGGTLFLDEVGDMPKAMQVRLLRVLESGVCRPVGSDREVSFKVRLVTASHKDLPSLVASGEFRKDLLYRLAGFTLRVPSLRERPEDIPSLLNHFAGKGTFTTEAVELLVQRQWPGNIRQLSHFVGQLKAVALPAYTPMDVEKYYPELPPALTAHPRDPSMNEAIRAHARATLATCQGNKWKAAKLLGISYKTMLKYVNQP